MPDIFPVQGTLNGTTGMIQDKNVLANYYDVPQSRDGLDLVFFASPMNEQLKVLEDNMIDVMANANLSDVQKQFTLQQLMNTWSAVSQGLTNMLKAVSDVNKAIVRNIE